MSLKVNTEKIKENYDYLDKYIKDYSDNSYNIFFELSKLSSCWNDDNKKYFDEKIIREKNSNIIILDELEEISRLLKNIENTYNKYNNGD